MKAEYAPAAQNKNNEDGDIEEHLKLDLREGRGFGMVNYNKTLLRKLRRASDNTEIRKEMFLKKYALDYCYEMVLKNYSVLGTSHESKNVKRHRTPKNGTFKVP